MKIHNAFYIKSMPSGRRNISKRPEVALLIETSNAYARGLLRGILAYVREHERWSVYLSEHGRGDRPPTWLRQWRGQGIIARIENRTIARQIDQTGVPVVDVSAARLLPNVPWIETDDNAIAEIAADHLLERGFRHFAYCGDSRFNWSSWRQQRFVDYLESRGFDCTVYQAKSKNDATKPMPWPDEERCIAKWVKALPSPVGLMACYDIRARQVLEAARIAEMKVPDELAVIGVDNDHLLCELADPPLSSVAPDAIRTGYEAAAILDRVMKGDTVSLDGQRVPPARVVTRQSTDVLAVGDRDISAAVRFIRQYACDGIDVSDVLRELPMSRRVFESRFKAILGRSPHQQIAKIRIERVQQLLTDTDLSLAAIAQRSGFRHAEYLSAAFKKATGQSPSAYRQGRQEVYRDSDSGIL